MVTKTIAVTGSEGFVGKHVVRALLQKPGVHVLRLARPGRATSMIPGTSVIEFDLRRSSSADFTALSGADALVHLAWEGLPSYRSEIHLDQVDYHRSFLAEAIGHGIRRVVVSGTCFEYGMVEGPVSEQCPPRPVTTYGQAKAELLKSLEDVQRSTGFSLVWARMFYVYGPGQAKSSLWSQVMSAIERADEHLAMSPGDQLRDYLHISKAAQLLAELTTIPDNPGVVNVCSGVPISVRDLVESWVAEHHARLALRLGELPYPDYEPFGFWGDPTYLRSILKSTR